MTITNLCQAFGCLPSPGGLFDQDSYIVYLMQCVSIAQSERAERERERDREKYAS